MPAERQDEKKPSGFTVSDRRTFAPQEDEAKAEEKQRPPAGETTAASTAPPEPVARGADPNQASGGIDGAPADDANASQKGKGSQGPLPTVDFHTFVLSLGSSALLHLGELDNPEGTQTQPDLPMAKHTIDIIAMLQEKTRGNLTAPEARLIESLLYDLRLRFVERNKK